MAPNIEYIIALGSNVGDRRGNLSRAIACISVFAEIKKESQILETWPILIRAQGKFLNQGIRIATDKNPHELLALLKGVEENIGRIKRIKNGPREIDIDIIWTSAGTLVAHDLKIPHPFNRAREWIRIIMHELGGDKIDADSGLAWNKIQGRSIMNVTDFVKKKLAHEKITVVTCYDFAFARLVARTSVDAVLIGDSLGNVIQGKQNTLAVTVDEMIYHARMVRRGAPQAFLIVDLPFMSYQTSVEDALKNAGRIIKETGADAVKLEGGKSVVPQIAAIAQSGIPVMGHLGLTPQSVLAFGGYKVQGKSTQAADAMVEAAQAIEHAGVFGVVLEMIPLALAEKISHTLQVPTIGIGAGDKTDGQVLVLHDLLGLDPDFTPRFVRKYADLSGQVMGALENYASDVRSGKFPDEKETFT